MSVEEALVLLQQPWSAYKTACILSDIMDSHEETTRNKLFREFAYTLGLNTEECKVFERGTYFKMIEKLWQEKPASFDDEKTAEDVPPAEV